MLKTFNQKQQILRLYQYIPILLIYIGVNLHSQSTLL